MIGGEMRVGSEVGVWGREGKRFVGQFAYMGWVDL